MNITPFLSLLFESEGLDCGSSCLAHFCYYDTFDLVSLEIA